MSEKDSSKLLNHTTKVEPMKTAGEIMGTLAAKGAQSVMIDYENGEPVGIAFKVKVGDIDVGYKLPSRIDQALKAMHKHPKIPARYCTQDQAKRTAWRILKSWVEAQMAMIELGQVEMAEVFLPYAIIDVNGQTLFQRFQQGPRLLLSGLEEKRLLGEGDNVVEGDFGT